MKFLSLFFIPTISAMMSKSGTDLQSLIDKASPGDVIQLLPIDYYGDFVLPAKASSEPITLRGTSSYRKSTTIYGSNRALTISGGSWIVSDLAVGSGQHGIVIKGSNHVLRSLSINGAMQGVVIDGDSNNLESLSINQGDEGIIVQGNENKILYTSCSGQGSVAVDVKSGSGTIIDGLSVNQAQKYSLILSEGSSNGKLFSLSLDGLLEVRGQSNEFSSISSSGAINVLGCGNSITSSSIHKIFVTKACTNELDDSNSIETHLSTPVKV